jgi:hypothetical protein
MRVFLLSTILLTAACLTGCHDHGSHDSITSYLSLHDGSVAVHAPGRPDAEIAATGDLTIAGTNVSVTGEQRDLLKHYYATAAAIRDHGIATGRAGAATGLTAIRSVASGLASGNPDKIDAEVTASANKIDASAALVCNDLAELRSTQENLARQLEAFRPYALIKVGEVENCPGRPRVRQRS